MGTVTSSTSTPSVSFEQQKDEFVESRLSKPDEDKWDVNNEEYSVYRERKNKKEFTPSEQFILEGKMTSVDIREKLQNEQYIAVYKNAAFRELMKKERFPANVQYPFNPEDSTIQFSGNEAVNKIRKQQICDELGNQLNRILPESSNLLFDTKFMNSGSDTSNEVCSVALTYKM